MALKSKDRWNVCCIYCSPHLHSIPMFDVLLSLQASTRAWCQCTYLRSLPSTSGAASAPLTSSRSRWASSPARSWGWTTSWAQMMAGPISLVSLSSPQFYSSYFFLGVQNHHGTSWSQKVHIFIQLNFNLIEIICQLFEFVSFCTFKRVLCAKLEINTRSKKFKFINSFN